jgi:hypothetical protein
MRDNGESRGIFEGYARGEERPLGAYLALIGFFNAIFALFLLAVRESGRPLPERIKLSDMALLGVATHKLSWLVATDVVTTPLRAPFTEFQQLKSPAKVEERPRGAGLRRALGELVTCQFCIGQWFAALFVYGLVLAPFVTRLVASIFTVLAFSDFLHETYRRW